ncbi:MAG: iron-containing alcohol dehydrogenase [Luteitalea sp.]|nr:iron-containing alcohol dehydrogenase [Luteitalea sp.]
MRKVTCQQPARLVVGSDAFMECVPYLEEAHARRVVVIAGSTTARLAAPLIDAARARGIDVTLWSEIAGEPTIDVFDRALAAARTVDADTIVGFGGGSALDAAKLVAGLFDDARPVRDVFGIGRVGRRRVRLVCVPTTAGTGSEVSPNAILLDDGARSKHAVISPFLVADAAFVDPVLARDLPPDVTATTGIDALTHCIEAFANRHAHPMVDEWALAGIRLIGANLVRAIRDGHDSEAREALALGSLYGGLCLGPVNTAAVHALAYPIGGMFGIGHGLSIALMLPHVLEFNVVADPSRYAIVAAALGVEPRRTAFETARAGVERCRALIQACGLPLGLASVNIPKTAIPQMVASALTVKRLLDNNPRSVTEADAAAVYEAAFDSDLTSLALESNLENKY